MSLSKHHLGPPEYALFQVLQWQKISVSSTFTTENDSGSKTSLRETSKYYLCLTYLSPLYLPSYHPEWNLFEPKGSIDSSTDCEVKDLVDLDTYDTKQVTDGSWSELEHWMGLLI